MVDFLLRVVDFLPFRPNLRILNFSVRLRMLDFSLSLRMLDFFLIFRMVDIVLSFTMVDIVLFRDGGHSPQIQNGRLVLLSSKNQRGGLSSLLLSLISLKFS